MKDVLPKYFFLLAIAAIVFAYGFLSGSMQVFPYQVIKEARIAFIALIELSEEKNTTFENLEYWDNTGLTEPTYKRLLPSAGEESVFVLGNDLTYGGQFEGRSFLAWIADRQGHIRHAWKHPGEIWAPLENRDAVGDTWRSYTIGAHLYPNGDLLVSYQGVNVFPISMGLAKFDKDSNLLWKRNGYYHHWFSVGPDGEIYVPGTVVGKSPIQIADRQKKISCSDDRFPYDSIAILDQNGITIKEIDLLDALINSDLVGVLNSNASEPIVLQSCDPLHLNDVQVLTEELSLEFPSLSAGDLLLSFRSLNGIGVLDPESERFKWFHVGTSQHQHSPRFYRNNQVLVFDNLGGQTSKGISRVVSIDIGSGRSEVLFPRQEMPSPSRDIFSRTAGHIDIHPSDDRMLVAFSEQGFVWEIDTNSGEVLWEFVNTHSIEDRPGRIAVYVAKYADKASFQMNGGEF